MVLLEHARIRASMALLWSSLDMEVNTDSQSAVSAERGDEDGVGSKGIDFEEEDEEQDEHGEM